MFWFGKSIANAKAKWVLKSGLVKAGDYRFRRLLKPPWTTVVRVLGVWNLRGKVLQSGGFLGFD